MTTEKKEISIEDKLRALYSMQLIDSKIDKIRSLRGKLPLEIEDLENEIAGLSVRIEKYEEEVTGFENEIYDKKLTIKQAEEIAKKYNLQQKTVRNNREYDSLNKEIEFQELEIQLSQKRIKEAQIRIEQKKELIIDVNEKLESQQTHLSYKKSKLDTILKETEMEENELKKKLDEIAKKLDEHLLNAYKRIKNSVKNGLAVVSIERNAVEGSYFVIPPQLQIEILKRKKINIDEYSGRILIDDKLAFEEKEKLSKILD